MRSLSHSLASTSGRDVAVCRCKTRRLQVHAALLEPPPFEPRKLSVQYLAGARPPINLSMPVSRRYTLTHNDLTGALNLSIGSDYNVKQIQGFYTRILRDEITAEWYFSPGASAPAELHIYCHVSGEEKWLAPPQLRNFIFRREMTLVLDTFYYADKEFLRTYPELLKAKVYVHFQSDVQDLDLREYWGTLGDRRSWRRMPRGILARLKLLLFGFPAVPHQRPRTSLTWQQQQRQQQQQPVSAAVAAAAAATSNAGVQQQPQQWHPAVESVVGQTRTVAFSLQEQRRMQQQEVVSLQGEQVQQQDLDQQQLAGTLLASSNGDSNSSGVSRQSQQSAGDCAKFGVNNVPAEQQSQQQAVQQASWVVAAVAVSEQAVQQQAVELDVKQDARKQQKSNVRPGQLNGVQNDQSSNAALTSVIELTEPVTTFQLVLQQPQMRIMRSAVVAAAGSHPGCTSRSPKQGM